MFSQEEVIGGLILYIKKELIPILPDYAKGIGGAILLRNITRLTQIAGQLTTGDMGRNLGIVEDGGQIDVDIWGQSLKDSIREFCGGRWTIQLPFLQPIYIGESDIDTLKRYIRGELR